MQSSRNVRRIVDGIVVRTICLHLELGIEAAVCAARIDADNGDVRRVPVATAIGLVSHACGVAVDDVHVGLEIRMCHDIGEITDGEGVGDRRGTIAAPEAITRSSRGGDSIALPLLGVLIYGDLDTGRTHLIESNCRRRNDYNHGRLGELDVVEVEQQCVRMRTVGPHFEEGTNDSVDISHGRIQGAIYVRPICSCSRNGVGGKIGRAPAIDRKSEFEIAVVATGCQRAGRINLDVEGEIGVSGRIQDITTVPLPAIGDGVVGHELLATCANERA